MLLSSQTKKVVCDLIRSMTGFGQAQIQTETYSLRIEVKTVNHRFLEVVLRAPRHLGELEEGIKKYVQSRLRRGRVEIFIAFEEIGIKMPVLAVDNDLALAYHKSLLQLADLLDIERSLDLKTLVSLPGIVSLSKSEDDMEEIKQLAEASLAEAIDALISMREEEGARLAADLKARIVLLIGFAKEIAGMSKSVVTDYQSKLQERIAELLNDVQVDESRLANEVAFFADRADISEELTRLDSHFSQFSDILESEEAAGRKLEFILQEMNREVNTIGSKANDLRISRLVIEAKSELEKMREQVQNIE